MAKDLDIVIWGIVGHKIWEKQNLSFQVPEMRASWDKAWSEQDKAGWNADSDTVARFVRPA
jgi:hypothetical protein